ncbi:hypothetical protein [Cupriavidus sp. UYPR2.512]|uniref:hypothetical protein n=1 Tax=Cupriavidus sp. UYPR2.512 TaxID=1080187 RepID=UPI000372CD21|nr:hypothetical protein [Cupriavidus sp. UYPR2.512]UIF85151.1 hypothetical protein KAF44_13385 [Cupriavidus necator]
MPPIPSPKERPELYDYGDVPEDRKLSAKYVARTMPEHVKKLIAERHAKATTPAQNNDASE